MSEELIMHHAFICTDNEGAMYLDEVITTNLEDSRSTILEMVLGSEKTHAKKAEFCGHSVLFVYNEGIAGNGATDHDLYLPSVIIGTRVDACIVITHNAELNASVLESIAVYQKAFLDGDAEIGGAEVDKWNIDKKEYICNLLTCIMEAGSSDKKEEE